MKKPIYLILSAFLLVLRTDIASADDGSDVAESRPPLLINRAQLDAATQHQPTLSADDIITRAHSVAGGVNWQKPGRLKLTGYNIIRRGSKEVLWDKYAMWREYAEQKSAAHSVSGKVRIEAWSGDKLAMLLAYDGNTTYNQHGALEDQSANAMWSANFGYGAIRNALDKGWQQKRLADDMVDGHPSFMLELEDPSGGLTRFGIRQADFAIVYVGFDTPRGWHERRYSNFFRKEGINWLQPGRVRLFYNGVKANEAIWLDFQVFKRDNTGNDVDWVDNLFKISSAPEEPTF